MTQFSTPTAPTAAQAYGFRNRLRPEFPSQVVADTTEVCNLACTHCTHPTFKKTEHYAARMLNPELNRKMVDEVREHGQGITQYIRYSGNGEPLLHSHIFAMLSYAVEQARTMVTLTSNGTLLNAARISRLLETKVDLVDISLDAFKPETYASIRVKGDFESTRANVQALLTAVHRSGSRTKVVVSFIEQPTNTTEIRDFEAFWRDQGAHQVVVRRMHTNANSLGTAATPVPTAARRPCLYPWERILLTPTGNLAFCPQDWIHASALADYHTTTIRATWQGETYRRLRAAHLANDFCQHKFCGQCPDWATTRWPGKGLSYADLVEGVRGGT